MRVIDRIFQAVTYTQRNCSGSEDVPGSSIWCKASCSVLELDGPWGRTFYYPLMTTPGIPISTGFSLRRACSYRIDGQSLNSAAQTWANYLLRKEMSSMGIAVGQLIDKASNSEDPEMLAIVTQIKASLLKIDNHDADVDFLTWFEWAEAWRTRDPERISSREGDGIYSREWDGYRSVFPRNRG